MLRKILSQVFNYDPRYRTRTVRRLATGVPGNESTRQVPDRTFRKWTEVPISKLDDGSYVQRLEKEKGNQGSRTTRLSKQSEGMGTVNQEIPDPWWD